MLHRSRRATEDDRECDVQGCTRTFFFFFFFHCGVCTRVSFVVARRGGIRPPAHNVAAHLRLLLNFSSLNVTVKSISVVGLHPSTTIAAMSASEPPPPPPVFVEMLPHELAMDAHGVFFAVYPLRLVRGCVRKRYRNFQDLDSRLRALPAAHRPQRKDLPVLTSKRWGAGLRDDVIDKRRRKLSEYLQELSSLAAGYPAVRACDNAAAAP
jgi:hypothetical protein